MPNRVVHFEIEALDKERAKKFYEKAFGWEMEQMGDDYSDYIVATTGDKQSEAGINGGIYQSKDKKELNAYRCVIGVEDIEKAMKDVAAAGGKVFHQTPDDIPKVGLFASCEDSEGNKFTLLQPSMETMA